jgi:hypothetical protein
MQATHSKQLLFDVPKTPGAGEPAAGARPESPQVGFLHVRDYPVQVISGLFKGHL